VIGVKTTNTKALLFVFLIVSGMIVSPISAYYQKMDITASDSNLGIVQHPFTDVTTLSFSNGTDVISVVNMKVPIGTTVNFTATYGNGATISGSTAFSSVVPYVYSRREIRLSTGYAYQDFVDPVQLGQDTEILSYASDMSDNGTAISQGFMLHNPATFGGENILVYVPISGSFAANLLTSITITSTQPIDVLILTDTPSNTVKLAEATSKNFLDTGLEWVNFATGIAGALLGFVLMVFGLIKFFFIDNLLLIIALWFGVSMAYSAISTRDIFGFYKKFFGFQRTLLDFIVGLWNTLVQIIAAFRGIFRI
jgi:hypothetical protein